MEKAKRAWIYCYIDAPEDTHGVLKGQHEKLNSYANQMCFTAVGSSHDLGNGLTLNRPGLTELMEAAIIGKMDVLIIDSFNRIGRDTKQALEFLHKLNGYGVKVYSPLEGKINIEHQKLMISPVLK
ncbi:recombinase [Carnobacterium maltaromaticum]|uniref:recombinase family protein n=1 Tax=Carnobacterium maltaromaticum TaxID=2751 RepID=UPI001072DCEA|nr:recombinase family protein [Carnobacterium maltaromaticum]MDT1943990.1 recombinase family protein [Carnobacterium maltaromaticum]MDT1999370.1 recombinase family protein [Carnobacterium maltaromaticum]TFJ24209.1 recombinase [Carnobacterium maltaromaticum]TFJ29614.1 recombinase [Carnobacterium maltaromaticum]TFJ32752.1 recombinase [Carnobacterium maltaromaticum]